MKIGSVEVTEKSIVLYIQSNLCEKSQFTNIHLEFPLKYSQ